MNETEQFLRHRGPVTCAAEIPGTRKIITSGYDGATALFDRETKQATLLGYHSHLVNRVTVNHQGTLAATVSSDYTIYLWNLTTGKVVRVLQGHNDDVEDFAFIDENRGASVSRDWRIIIWNLSTGNIERIILGHEKDVLSVSYLEDQLFTSGDDMTLRVWDLNTGKQLSMWGPFQTETDTCAIDPLHKRAVLGCDDGAIRVFDIGSGQLLAELPAHAAGIKKVAVSPATGDILSAAYDQRILVWDVNSFQQKQQLESHPALWERSFNWSPDGERVVAGTFDGTVLIWQAETGQCLDELGDRSTCPGNACFNDIAANRANQIVAVSDDGYVRLGQLDAGTAQWNCAIAPDSGRILMNAIATDTTNQRIIAGTHNRKLHLFKTLDSQLQQEQTIDLAEGPINCIRTSEHPEFAGHLFVGCYTGAIAHLDRDGHPIDKIWVHENAVKALRLHPHQAIGVSCSADGLLASWDYNGNLIRHYAGHTAIVDDVDIDPTGTYIASAGRDFILKIHGIEDGVLYHSIPLGRRSPKAVCFLETDVVIVTNYWGELLRVSLTDGQILRSTVAQNGISSITRLNGSLAAASYDGAIYLVQQDDLSVIQTLRSMTQKVRRPMFA